MKTKYAKLVIAFGFFSLLGMFFILFGIVINEFKLLSKENVGFFPPDQQFSIEKSEKIRFGIVRSFSIDGKAAETIPILMYHRIIEKSEIQERHYINGEINSMIVLKEDFEKQMDYLYENDYVTLTLQELYLYLTYKIDIPEKSVVLTFDDGYKDNFVEAYPILKKRDFNAVNFIITGSITKRVYPFTPEHVQYFSLKELNKGSDVFEYQSHTYSYHRREKNNHNQSESFLYSKTNEQVFEDIKISVHHLNGENLAFAYPYGEYLPSTIEIVKDLGFKMAFTVENRVATREDHIYEIPRYSVLYNTTFKEFKEYVGN
ncbi:MAG: polysaccharide deacetylase family protein [Paenisporosarcina sp.]